MTGFLKKRPLEVMCFRQGRKGFDTLLRKEKKLTSYWHNFFSNPSADTLSDCRHFEPWTSKTATSYFRAHTHLTEQLRYAGKITSEKGRETDIYFAFLTEDKHDILSASQEYIMWVNSFVLHTKLVTRADKFKPDLLDMLETCLKYLNRDHAIAV